jgi:hypothetical protein
LTHVPLGLAVDVDPEQLRLLQPPGAFGHLGELLHVIAIEQDRLTHHGLRRIEASP